VLIVGELKLSLCLIVHYAQKIMGEGGDMAPRILNLNTRWRSVVSFTSRPLYYRRNSLWNQLGERLEGLQNRSGRLGEEKVKFVISLAMMMMMIIMMIKMEKTA
jgi:hypothetical protein